MVPCNLHKVNVSDEIYEHTGGDDASAELDFEELQPHTAQTPPNNPWQSSSESNHIPLYSTEFCAPLAQASHSVAACLLARRLFEHLDALA